MYLLQRVENEVLGEACPPRGSRQLPSEHEGELMRLGL